MAEYEFSHVSKAERAKIILAKVFLGLFIAHGFLSLCGDGGDLASKVSDVASILLFTFAYINVLQVKSELALLFEPPYLNHGFEFLIGFVILKFLSWFL
tara:strand:- start:8403 stop:8699 length:297 start_codon:yes stop_codon:yes gene_type:complete